MKHLVSRRPLSSVLSSCVAVVAASGLFAVAPGCSSDTTGDAADGGRTSSADAGHAGGSGGDADGSAGGRTTGDASTCSCDVTYNDVNKVLDCGESGCVDGEQFSCASGSGAVDQGACSSASDASVDAAGHDAGGDAGTADAAPMCMSQGGDCSFDGTCCSGTYCGAGNEVCVIDLGGACTSSSQCESAVPPVSPGASCTSGVCCANPGYACVTEGPDAECCSGSCGAPNKNGISFCE